MEHQGYYEFEIRFPASYEKLLFYSKGQKDAQEWISLIQQVTIV